MRIFRSFSRSKPSLTSAPEFGKIIEKPSISMVDLQKNIQWWWSRHWKTIDGNGALEKNITIPSLWKNDHRRSLVRKLIQIGGPNCQLNISQANALSFRLTWLSRNCPFAKRWTREVFPTGPLPERSHTYTAQFKWMPWMESTYLTQPVETCRFWPVRLLVSELQTYWIRGTRSRKCCLWNLISTSHRRF